MDWEKIFKDYREYIFSYASVLTRNRSEAEDLTQDTFLIAIDRESQLKSIESIKYWLRTICFNKYLMKIRKEKNFSSMSIDSGHINYINVDMAEENPQPSIEDEVIFGEEIEEIRSACFLSVVHRMKLNQRMIFSMIDMFGLSIHETGELMKMSEAAVKSNLHRARKKVDEELIGRCGLINVKNPFSCKAWRNFVLERNKRREKTRYSIKKQNISEPEKSMQREGIRELFSNMPDCKPSSEWFDEVIKKIKILL